MFQLVFINFQRVIYLTSKRLLMKNGIRSKKKYTAAAMFTWLNSLLISVFFYFLFFYFFPFFAFHLSIQISVHHEEVINPSSIFNFTTYPIVAVNAAATDISFVKSDSYIGSSLCSTSL